jgi:hypothetical protein
LVNSGLTQLVLAASATDVSYELDVKRHLLQDGWPVPELARGPTRIGDTTRCLITRLPGTQVHETRVDRCRRGRLLA